MPARCRSTSSAAGPGNLTMAMGITLAENRLDLLGDRLFVEDRGIRVGAGRLGPAHRHQGRDRASVAGVRRGPPGGLRKRSTRVRLETVSAKLEFA